MREIFIKWLGDWGESAECHLWFFDDGLPGYSWYVPKANGYINIGVGGMAEQLKKRDDRIRDYWQKFVARLQRQSELFAAAPSGWYAGSSQLARATIPVREGPSQPMGGLCKCQSVASCRM